jgi:hypothetical protein
MAVRFGARSGGTGQWVELSGEPPGHSGKLAELVF